MAIKKVYIGSFGPILYDDTDPIGDADGDFAGETRQAVVTDGQMIVETAPVGDDEVKRYGDDAGSYSTLINSIVTYEGSVVVHNGNVVTS